MISGGPRKGAFLGRGNRRRATTGNTTTMTPSTRRTKGSLRWRSSAPVVSTGSPGKTRSALGAGRCSRTGTVLSTPFHEYWADKLLSPPLLRLLRTRMPRFGGGHRTRCASWHREGKRLGTWLFDQRVPGKDIPGDLLHEPGRRGKHRSGRPFIDVDGIGEHQRVLRAGRRDVEEPPLLLHLLLVLRRPRQRQLPLQGPAEQDGRPFPP